MKKLYINSRLRPLLLGKTRLGAAGQWIFSQGDAWLLLTPPRFARLAARLGLGDGRVHRLLGLVKRHLDAPEEYCRRVGLPASRRLVPKEYPPMPCPMCDGIHYPHPEDVGTVCPDCRERERLAERRRPPGGATRDRHLDKLARKRLMHKEPRSFDGDTLSPNYRINLGRRLQRDWDGAVNRILMGMRYRDVAREFSCSVGLLHRKVMERKHWENN